MKDKAPVKNQNLFIFLSVLISLTLSIIVAEWVLRYQSDLLDQQVNKSEQMEPGMILYDAQLGWKLKPYWSGKHHHYDYDVSYNINREGFRGTDAPAADSFYSIVGDSFSFGLGVNDDETFAALLNRGSNSFRNFSVPGYSTDQQLLLIDKLNHEISNKVLLMVYLGNDIFDNKRAYPLQAEHGKPYFKLDDNKLSLENTPVPLLPKPAAARAVSISSIVLAGDDKSVSWLAGLEISRRLGLLQKNIELSETLMQSRFSESLKLFTALVYEIDKRVGDNDGQLSVILLPGRSYVEQPASLSAQYQEYFRHSIKSSLETSSSIILMDLASHLRQLNDSGIKNLYHPNEGHLTALGHQHVADYLAEEINKLNLQ